MIRELSPLAPVRVVVSFNSPAGSSNSSLEFSEGFTSPSGVGGTTTSVGLFPELPGFGHFRLDNAIQEYKTFGDLPTFGFSLLLPPKSSAYIAAIPIRDHFTSIPEPATVTYTVSGRFA